MSEWSPAERLVSGPALIGATRPSVDVQSVLCDDAQGDHVKELVKLDDRLTRREVPVEGLGRTRLTRDEPTKCSCVLLDD